MKKAYLQLHTAVLLAGFTGVFGKMISLNEALLVWYRVLLSGFILFIILKLTKTSFLASKNDKLKMMWVGVIIAIHWVFFYASIKYANISIGVVCYCLTSFFTAIFEPIINKRKFEIQQILLSLITLVGISLIFHFDVTYQTGIILGVISSSFAALYTILNEKLVKANNNKVNVFYQMLGGGAVLTLLLPGYLFYFSVNHYWPDLNDVWLLFCLALFCTVGLYVLVAEVLKQIPAFTVNLSFNLEPIYAIVIAFLFFDEGREVNASFYIGLVIVMASVVAQSVITLYKKRKKAKQQTSAVLANV